MACFFACTVGIAFWVTSSKTSSTKQKVVNKIDKPIVHPLFKPIKKKNAHSEEKLEKYRNMRQKAHQKMTNKLINYSNSTQKTQVAKLSTLNRNTKVISTIELTASTTTVMTRNKPTTITSLFEASLCKKLGLSKKKFWL